MSESKTEHITEVSSVEEASPFSLEICSELYAWCFMSHLTNGSVVLPSAATKHVLIRLKLNRKAVVRKKGFL